MSRTEYIISDFASAVVEKDHLANSTSRDRWEVASYETTKTSGRLLIASGISFPEPVTVEPALTGWYKIYVCMGDFGGGMFNNHINLQLSGDEFGKTMRACNIGPFVQWALHEQVEEAFWKAADMTGQSITISKLRDGTGNTANIYWLRFVPMTDDEVSEYKARIAAENSRTMFAHMDGDFHLCDCTTTPRSFCKVLAAMKDSDVKIISQEVSNDLVDYSNFDPDVYVGRNAWATDRMAYTKKLWENREEIYKIETAYAHEHGMELFAAQRMALSSFAFPYAQALFSIKFVNEHPEFACMTRDGRSAGFMSFAFREVQDFLIESFRQPARCGFDGVTLLFTRGVHVLFEEPVAQRLKAKYPDANLSRLPANDPRLVEVWGDVMTEFMSRLREGLKRFADEYGTKPMKIYLTGYYSVEDSRNSGLDIERFAREGLIDGVIQSNMTVWEETDDALAEDGLVDVEKLADLAKTQYIVRRLHGNLIDKTTAALPEYRRIADQYGIQLYSELQWESSVQAEEFVKAAKEIYAAGGMNIALWDCYPARVQNLSEWDATSQLGNAEHVADMSTDRFAYHKVYKILSYNGADMRFYHPSWRG